MGSSQEGFGSLSTTYRDSVGFDHSFPTLNRDVWCWQSGCRRQSGQMSLNMDWVIEQDNFGLTTTHKLFCKIVGTHGSEMD